MSGNDPRKAQTKKDHEHILKIMEAIGESYEKVLSDLFLPSGIGVNIDKFVFIGMVERLAQKTGLPHKRVAEALRADIKALAAHKCAEIIDIFFDSAR